MSQHGVSKLMYSPRSAADSATGLCCCFYLSCSFTLCNFARSASCFVEVIFDLILTWRLSVTMTIVMQLSLSDLVPIDVRIA